jgi:hypothetical protein
MRFFTMDYDASCAYLKGYPVFEERLPPPARTSIFEMEPEPLLYRSPMTGGGLPSYPMRLLVAAGGDRCTTREVGRRIGIVFKEPTIEDPALGVEV